MTMLNDDLRIGSYRGNCCLVAMQNAMPTLNEADVVRTCKRNGFRSGRGMFKAQWLNAARELGLELQPIDMFGLSNRRQTLTAFCREAHTGTYLVQVSRHLLVIHNGRIVDPNCPNRTGRRRVKSAFFVLNSTRTSTSPIFDPSHGRVIPANVPKARVPRTRPMPVPTPTRRKGQRLPQDPQFRFTKTVTRNGQTFGPTTGVYVLSNMTRYTRKQFRHDLRQGNVVLA